jgi:hypothetical protein
MGQKEEDNYLHNAHHESIPLLQLRKTVKPLQDIIPSIEEDSSSFEELNDFTLESQHYYSTTASSKTSPILVEKAL